MKKVTSYKLRVTLFLSLFFFAVFSVLLLGFTGCKKDPHDDNIIGKWKLVDISDGDKYPVMPMGPPEIKDSLKYNLIYDFQKNNKLIILNSVVGELHENKYSYKYHHAYPEYYGDPPRGNNLQIEKTKFSCVVFEKQEVMVLLCHTEKILDEYDEMMSMKDSVLYWRKTFVKLK